MAKKCKECNWRPSPRLYGTGSEQVGWREEPAIASILYNKHPELAELTTIGARLFASVLENA